MARQDLSGFESETGTVILLEVQWSQASGPMSE